MSNESNFLSLSLHGKFNSIGEQIKALYVIAEDQNHPEHEEAKRLRSKLWGVLIQSSGGLAKLCGLKNPYPEKPKKDERFVFR